MTEHLWQWSTAHGSPLGQGIIRSVPEDFQVTELLEPEPVVAAPGGTVAGQSEHLWLWIEKREQNTTWVANLLARHFGVRSRDVSWAGLKDRHAVTRQWFSVWLPGGHKSGVLELPPTPGVRVASHQWARQKVRRGEHQGNRFKILVRAWQPDPKSLNTRLEAIRTRGVPNYFGPQRFGHEFDPSPKPVHWTDDRQQRGFQISALRSYVFNRLLQQQIDANTWGDCGPGDWVSWRGSNAGFVLETLDDRLQSHLHTGELSPTAWLPGEVTDAKLAPTAAERAAIGPYQVWVDQLCERRVQSARRSTVLMPREMTGEVIDDGVVVTMTLPPGSFATSILAELCRIIDPARDNISRATTGSSTA